MRHPAAYSSALSRGRSPAQAHERLTAHDVHVERILLETRLAAGLDLAELDDQEVQRVPALIDRGLVDTTGGRLRLTLEGRLLADAVVREIID